MWRRGVHCLAVWLILQRWRLRRYVPLKRWLYLNKDMALYSKEITVCSQIILFASSDWQKITEAIHVDTQYWCLMALVLKTAASLQIIPVASLYSPFSVAILFTPLVVTSFHNDNLWAGWHRSARVKGNQWTRRGNLARRHSHHPRVFFPWLQYTHVTKLYPVIMPRICLLFIVLVFGS
jgi:hypothetical protein